MSCDTEVLNSLMQSISCSKPAYCPPCVSAVSAVADSNTVRIAALEAGLGGTMISGTNVLDFGSIAADDEAELTIPVNGASVGDAVVLGAPAAIEAGLVWTGYVSAADTVKVRVRNTTAGAIDPASATWKAAVIVIP